MLTSPSLGPINPDVNTQRALEQLVLIVGDVEQRLSLVKSTLAQIWPTSFPPHNQLLGIERAGVPLHGASLPTLAPYGNVAAGQLTPFGTPFGLTNQQPFIPGVTAPLYPGIGAPGYSFRLR